ncbi:MAG: sugar phosphate isomerase/epimerase [Rhodospirillaceae bacterium]|nr:MAG: sugar phosphate isomerase/epimerase [Rhodospirillaceae bacterium]
MQPSRSDWVMYHHTVRSLPLKEQFRAASLAGCGALTTGPHEYLTMLTQGISTRDMKKMAADFGIRFDHLDAFARWVPQRPDQIAEMMRYDEDDFFRIADALEAKSLGAIALFPKGAISMNEMIDGFGQLCRRAARHGLKVALEFIPMGAVYDLATAWQIISSVNAPNSGIVFDFWHYYRGHPDDALLRSIPGRWIAGVQFDDATATLPTGVTMVEDTVMRRKAPGEGEFRIREVVAILRDIGGLNNPGPEILSAEFDKMTAEEIAAKVRSSMTWALSVN